MSHSPTLSAETLQTLTEAALDAAKGFGADAADAVASRSASLSVEVRLGKLETVERSESASLGLRVMVGRKQAGAATSDLRASAVRELAEDRKSVV